MVGLFIGKQLQHGEPLRRIGRLRQDLTVVSKILFVNEVIHADLECWRRERYRTLSHRTGDDASNMRPLYPGAPIHIAHIA